jgi:hypothetical protein
MNTSKQIVKTDSLWQHKNGDRYRIVGLGKHMYDSSNPKELDLFGQYLRLGSFSLASSFGSIDLFDYQGHLIYGELEDLGELVFYSGDSGRWTSNVNNFILHNIKINDT